MQLLTLLTLVYLAVLVLALAASLIAIFVYLWRIGSALREVRDALNEVEANTAPLTEHIETVNGGLTHLGQGLDAVEDHLALTDDSLKSVAARISMEKAA